MITVDLNADLGEGQGDDEALLSVITSANVACGLHAGDPPAMRRTVEVAARAGVAVGAHPGFADREHFGRRELPLSPVEIHDLVAYQIGALAAFTRKVGIALGHVKLHGGLYHLANRRADVAAAVVSAAREAGGNLIVVGAPGSALAPAACDAGLHFAAEGFADRGYGDDGNLVSRADPQALLSGDDASIAARAVAMVRDRRVTTVGGESWALSIQTLCLHGDDARALGRAQAIRAAFRAAGIVVSPLDRWLAT